MPESSGRLPLGKLPLEALSNLLALVRPFRRSDTVQGPYPGEDAGIIRLPCCDIAVHTDPITEASSMIGWLAVNIAANDVATSGACPAWASVAVLAHPGSQIEDIKNIIEGIGRAARELGIDVVGGHTEVAPGIVKPIAVATIVGITCRGCAIRTGDARPGDAIIYAGYAGTEGTGILARDFRRVLRECNVDEATLAEAERLGSKISIVQPACALAREGLARAMHDVTEGGAIGALVEMAIASGKSIIIDEARIPIHPSTSRIAACLGIDPLKLIGSGSFVAAVPSALAGRAVDLLRGLGYPSSIIGRVEEGDPCVTMRGGEKICAPPRDEISRVWEQYGEAKEKV